MKVTAISAWTTSIASHVFMRTVYLIVATTCFFGFWGCVATDDKGRRPYSTRETPAQTQANLKSQTLETQAFTVQQLLVREEHGQTTVQIKFSQPVSQFRHFVLAQPARLVLDVFGDTARLTQVESFPIDTHWVSTLRLSSVEGSLRLTAEIAAATVPAYVVSPEDGGLKVIIGSADPKMTTKKLLSLVEGGKRTGTKTVAASSTESKSPVSPVDLQPIEKTYTGQRISLDF